jgi:hypothetical protein
VSYTLPTARTYELPRDGMPLRSYETVLHGIHILLTGAKNYALDAALPTKIQQDCLPLITSGNDYRVCMNADGFKLGKLRTFANFKG